MKADNAAGWLVGWLWPAFDGCFDNRVTRILRCVPQFKGNSLALLLIIAIIYRWRSG
jgi:hypothetical protein